MTSLPLSLKYSERPVRRAVAWLVPARHPAAWLDEICRWQVPMRGMRVYILPRSRETREPLGALVTVPEGSPRTSRRALPYGLVGKRLYLPTESELHPAIDEAELAELLPGEVVVLHPSVGLIGFGEDDALTVGRLLCDPRRGDSTRTRATWDAAEPGVTLNRRVHSLSAASLPSVEDAIDRGRDDIGSTSPGELKKLPSEPSRSTVADVGRAVGYGVFKGAHFVLEGLARGLDKIGGAEGTKSDAGPPGLLEKWLGWTDAAAASLLSRIEFARYREIARLLDLMERDVDEGLRYALPLGGLGHRGIAPPSTRLARRRVDFSLRSLAGGKAADFWDIPWHFQEQLRQSYLEAARREIALGRHRRAAYIYAELLVDFHAAADALRRGGHYREAATLYRDRLQKSLLAAECLEEGGFLKEAIELYEEKGRFEKVAELYGALGDEEESVRAYRRAAEAALGEGDRVHAARIYETKLDAPRQALAILSSGWPSSAQAGPCLREQFALMGRMGWHDGASRAVDVFKGLSLEPDTLGVLSTALVRVANSYPDRAVRRRVADAVRVVVAGRLSHASADELERLTRCIARLDPDDRLLKRDAHRYRSGRRRAAGRVRSRADITERRPRGSRESLAPVREFSLPAGYVWCRFATARRRLYAAGLSRKTPRVALWRQDWQGHGQFTSWPRSAHPTLLVPSRSGECPVILATSEDEGFAVKTLPGDGVLNAEKAGTPQWLNRGSVCHACVYSTDDTLYTLKSRSSGLSVHLHNRQGQLLRVEDLDVSAVDEENRLEVRAALVGEGELWFSRGRHLHGVTRTGGIHTVELEDEVVSLCASPSASSPRVVATSSEGGRVVWCGSHLGEEEPFARDLADPVAGFTSDGFLIAVSKEEGRTYQSQGRKLRARMSFKGPGRTPLAVLPTDRSGEFAVATDDGRVRVYSLPSL